MELSQESFDSLQVAGDSTHVPDKNFVDLLENTCQCLLEPKTQPSFLESDSLSAIERAALKQAHGAVATLFLEAAKHDQDTASLGHLLEDCKFSADRIKAVADVYEKYKAHLRAHLSCTGHEPPHIVGVDWRLDHYMKSSQLEKVEQPTYMIRLTSQRGDDESAQPTEFSCTQEQLQDLVGKLRDACKSVERASQM